MRPSAARIKSSLALEAVQRMMAASVWHAPLVFDFSSRSESYEARLASSLSSSESRRRGRWSCQKLSGGWICGAKNGQGIEGAAESIGEEEKMKDDELVITGEGSLDRQTLEGKTPVGVARLARKLGKPVFAIVGRASEDRELREIFEGIYQNTRPGMSQKEHMKRAAALLRET